MTNPMTNSTHDKVQNYARAAKGSDAAPMIITRLSGWIDMGEPKTTTPSWIVRTRVSAGAR